MSRSEKTATRPADPTARSIVVSCKGRKDRKLPVKVTVLPTADFDASVGVFVDVSYTPELAVAPPPEVPTKRKVRVYRLATQSTLTSGASASYAAIIKLPEQSATARPWYVRARFAGESADIRSAWTRIA